MARREVVVIWLDGTFERGRYEAMKDEFNEQIAPSPPPPPPPTDPINNLIIVETTQDLENNGVVVLTVSTPAAAIELIKKHSGAKIIFISSGSLGKDMVPQIVGQYALIHSFYIFCFKMDKHCEWASDYASCLQMFDHPVDLLVRLMRDISQYFIEQGKMNLSLNDPAAALQYFKHSWDLETRANKRDKMESNPKEPGQALVQSDYREHLNLLEGENGLIRTAEQALSH